MAANNLFGDIFTEAQGWLDPGDAFGMQRDREAQKQLQERYAQMHQAYSQYRPEALNSQMNALNQQIGAFGPLNNLMGQMYGQGSMMDLAAMGKSPFTAGFMQAGKTDPASQTPQENSELPLGLTPEQIAAGVLLGPEAAAIFQPVVKGLRGTRTADPAYGDIAAGAGYGATTTPPPDPKNNPLYQTTYGFRGPGR